MKYFVAAYVLLFCAVSAQAEQPPTAHNAEVFGLEADASPPGVYNFATLSNRMATVIPGSAVHGEKFTCQFASEGGWRLSGPFTAEDVATGKVVFHLQPGEVSAYGPLCINAPYGHDLKVSAE